MAIDIIFFYTIVTSLLAKTIAMIDIDNTGPFSSLRGPLIRQNFPDPCVIFHDGTTYAFATNNRKAQSEIIHIQVATSGDNDTWNVVDGLDALPIPAAWQTGRAVWAPDVKQLPDGRFLLYYTDSLKSRPSTHCIGAAVSQQITGPYRPQSQPLICPRGGAIDPAGFYDRTSGKRYMLYKVDGNNLGNGGLCKNDVLPIKSTPIMLQEVDPNDGITIIGDPVQLLDRSMDDGPLIEAPAMYLSKEGIYFLFFSASCFTTPNYHTSYATSLDISGPYSRAARPLLISGDGLNIEGPGGMDIIHHSYAVDQAEIFPGGSNDREHKSDSRLILFHGRLYPYNDPKMKKLVSGRDSAQRPIHDLHLPFVRGMYSGVATFRGRSVSLGENRYEKMVV